MAMRLGSKSDQSNSELNQSQSHFGFMSFACLKSAIDLGIPEIVHTHGCPMTLPELINALPGVNKSKSHRISLLMSVLAHSGLFVKEEGEEEECYSIGPAMMDRITGKLKIIFHPVVMSAWLHMGEWFTNADSTPFETAHGMSFWEYTFKDTKFNNFFNHMMASYARNVAKTVVRDCKGAFEGLNSVVDVGGGTGTFSKTIADFFPDIKCINFDLPHVVAGLEGSTNLTHIGGDMFLAIPQADAIILKWILHDWSDEECVKILKRCKEAIPSREKGGKVFIIDMLVGQEKKNDNTKSNGMESILYDLQMMVLTTGQSETKNNGQKSSSMLASVTTRLFPLIWLWKLSLRFTRNQE